MCYEGHTLGFSPRFMAINPTTSRMNLSMSGNMGICLINITLIWIIKKMVGQCPVFWSCDGWHHCEACLQKWSNEYWYWFESHQPWPAYQNLQTDCSTCWRVVWPSISILALWTRIYQRKVCYNSEKQKKVNQRLHRLSLLVLIVGRAFKRIFYINVD